MKSLYLNANAQTYFKEVALYIFVKQMCKSSKNCQIPFGSMEMYNDKKSHDNEGAV